jgi:hypothetical protein
MKSIGILFFSLFFFNSEAPSTFENSEPCRCDVVYELISIDKSLNSVQISVNGDVKYLNKEIIYCNFVNVPCVDNMIVKVNPKIWLFEPGFAEVRMSYICGNSVSNVSIFKIGSKDLPEVPSEISVYPYLNVFEYK